jgi:hypothetical protein
MKQVTGVAVFLPLSIVCPKVSGRSVSQALFELHHATCSVLQQLCYCPSWQPGNMIVLFQGLKLRVSM